MEAVPDEIFLQIFSHVAVNHHHHVWTTPHTDLSASFEGDLPSRHAVRHCPFNGCFCCASLSSHFTLRRVCHRWNGLADILLFGLGLDCSDPIVRGHIGEKAWKAYFSPHATRTPVTALNLSGCSRITDSFLDRLLTAYGPTLRALDISFSASVTANCLYTIGHACPHLTALNLRNSRQLILKPTLGIPSLVSMTHLRLLDISNLASESLSLGNAVQDRAGQQAQDAGDLPHAYRRHYDLPTREELEEANPEYFGLVPDDPEPVDPAARPVRILAEGENLGDDDGRPRPPVIYPYGHDPRFYSPVLGRDALNSPPHFAGLETLVADAPLLSERSWECLFQALCGSPLSALVLGTRAPLFMPSSLLLALLLARTQGAIPDHPGLGMLLGGDLQTLWCPFLPLPVPLLPAEGPLAALHTLHVPWLTHDPLVDRAGTVAALRAAAPGLGSLGVGLSPAAPYTLTETVNTLAAWFPKLRRLEVTWCSPPKGPPDGWLMA
ncbi:hypothetical protein PAPYR_9078 [Paratrimastix pyriformis]|uniref:F-box/LRR-repeat protein 15-like leucin rich repeat domain-containing protein n=1 Tax=Paratrimastix pyriformis TaxID=342808 RepID=A0ABQ8UEW0_9EUKA|nr:hypothetical protein PAPYR_9078 [Paratrimastix pyriformis]